mmetsp:Transcript_80280/g.231917  ORF Transcript_80280/g.231917 Transcript_80280/m.231917 type:complete len:80 (+) Transcript_80280:64-303(+)
MRPPPTTAPPLATARAKSTAIRPCTAGAMQLFEPPVAGSQRMCFEHNKRSKVKGRFGVQPWPASCKEAYEGNGKGRSVL